MKSEKQKIYLVQIGLKKEFFDAFGQDVLHSIFELGIDCVEKVYVYDVYKVYGNVNISLVKKLAGMLFFDPVAHQMKIIEYKMHEKTKKPCVEVWYKQGVTDPVALTAIKAIKDLGIQANIKINYGKKYEFAGRNINKKILETISTKILANTLIQEYVIKGL